MIVKKITRKQTRARKTSRIVGDSVEKKTQEKYLEAVGRRKTSIARVRMVSGGHDFYVNKKELSAYFPNSFWQGVVMEPLERTGLSKKFSFSVKVEGGGINSQAQAIRHGIARALAEKDESLRGILRAEGFLKRDPRMKERRKYGLKKARRAPQWSKR